MPMRGRAATWFIVFVILASAGSAQSPGGKKAPAPEPLALKAAETLIRDAFKEDYSKSAPADRGALAKKLLKQGSSATDPAERFVFFREARDLAAFAGDVGTALDAADGLIDAFDVDAVEVRSATLSALSKTARSPEDLTALAEASLALADESIARDDFKTALKAAKDASGLAKRAQETVTTLLADEKARDIAAIQRKHQELLPARSKLQANPDDPEANLAVGRYLLLAKGDAERGLAHIAKGSDRTLRQLAERDLAGPAEPSAQVILADDWFSAAEGESGIERRRLRERARLLYERALPSLSGVAKVKVEKRIAQCWAEERVQVHSRSVEGRAGNRSSNHIYSFDLVPGGKTALLRFWVTAQSSSDTSGDVLLTGPQATKQVVYRWSQRGVRGAPESAASYKELKPATADVSKWVTGPGTYEVTFDYKRGRSALRILRVEIVIH